MARFPFKGYSWAVGTTSFRTVDFNVKIERQLDLLNKFWSISENKSERWEANNLLQEKYYRFMQEDGFVVGDAGRPDKDARQVTSGLVDIGLIDDERRLTNAGKALLNITEIGDFKSDNLLQISADSFIYLKQLLKTNNNVDGNIVRPFVVTAYALLKLGYLSNDEFTYLISLCSTRKNTAFIIDAIEQLRKGKGSIDKIILSRLLAMDNYKSAFDYFISESATEDVITTIGMNRKSRTYDKPYYEFYKLLRSVVLNKDNDSVFPLYEQSKRLNGKPATLWRQYLFNTPARRKIEREGLAVLNDIPLLNATSEDEFKQLFFEQMHLFKARATLSDYADLNTRYFKTTDAMIFADGKVILDVVPHCWLHSAIDELPSIAFSESDNLLENIELPEIAPFLEINEKKLYANLKTLYGITVDNADDAKSVVNNERYKRLNTLIDERFNRETLIDLLSKFECRDDNAIRQIVTNNADIPTIFEYILGIAWYVISDRCGDVLNYMNLSLEADLLPRTHASGGNADIEYLYEETKNYPAHCLLLEVTLAESSNQRRMEMEPVSRHLGEYILKTGDKNAYCVFVSTFLHRNVISDFRNRKTYQYYSDQYESCVDGLKILPLATAELRTILEHKINYDKLYSVFESAHRSNEPIPTWYDKEIISSILS
jgi:hypothetical protein